MRCPKCGSEVINDSCYFCGCEMPEENSNKRKTSERERIEKDIALIGLWTFLGKM